MLLTTSSIRPQYLLIRSLPHITINNPQPQNGFGIDLLIGHREQFIILIHLLHLLQLGPETPNCCIFTVEKANGQGPKTCVIASDTSLTISSLSTHAHYFCLVGRHHGFGRAAGRRARRHLPARHCIPRRPESRYDSALPPRPGSPITLLEHESAAASRPRPACSASDVWTWH